MFSLQNSLCRTHAGAFPVNDDDEWIFDTDLDQVTIGSGAASPLIEFELQLVGSHRN